MSGLERFLNDDALFPVDPLIKMALIHHQFESIHPFYDGNGRTAKGRIGISDTTQIQSDYVGSFNGLGRKHDLLAGVDIYQEDAKRANNFAGASSGLTTTVGTPDDGAWVDESSRVLRVNNSTPR